MSVGPKVGGGYGLRFATIAGDDQILQVMSRFVGRADAEPTTEVPAVTIHGDEKQLSMARSVLPAKANARKAARDHRRRVHHAARAQQRSALAGMPHDDAYDERGPLGPDVHVLPDGGTRSLVSRRRQADKLAPFIRWAEAHAQDLGPTPESRLAALGAILPRGIIGDHALSHLFDAEGFRTDDRPPWRDVRRAQADRRAREAQSLRDRLVHGVHQRLDRVGTLNRALKHDWSFAEHEDGERPRVLHGAHDVEPFVDYSMPALPELTGVQWRPPSDRLCTLSITMRFCDIDPRDPHAAHRARTGP